MKHALTAAACAAALVGGLGATTPADAQVGFGFGFGPSYGYGGPDYRYRDYDHGPRRVYRSYDDDDEGDCRIVVRRSVDPYGRVRVRRIRECY
jgi:hypothetical protein